MKLNFNFFLISSLFFISSLFAKNDSGDPEENQNVKVPSDLNVLTNIVFKTVGTQKLDMYIFPVKSEKPSPLVVYIHGGGWAHGDKNKVFNKDIQPVLRGLLQNGIACASIEYRLCDEKSGSNAYDAIVDCKDAIRFLVKNAQTYGIDSNRIGTFGSSAGGHLTLVAALGVDNDFLGDKDLSSFSPKIACVVAYYPLTTLFNSDVLKTGMFSKPRPMMRLLGGSIEEKTDLAKKISPVDLLKNNSPPIFLAHGTDDQVLSVENSKYFYSVAQSKGVSVELILSEHAGHTFTGTGISPSIPEINQKTVDFFIKHLNQ
jgi:acetyl esterase/lipase